MAAPHDVIYGIEHGAAREYLPIAGKEIAAFVERIIKEKKPCTVVEVGVLVGYLTLHVARSLQQGCKVVGFEISEELARRARENVAAADFADRVTIVRADARESLGTISGPVDVVILDAERTQYLNYLRKLERVMSPGAVVIAIGTGGVSERIRAYLDHVRMSGSYQSRTETFGTENVEVSVYKG